MSEFIRVGRIVNTHGLKGHVKVELLTDFEQRLAKGTRLRLRDDWVTVEESRWQNDRLVLKLSNIGDIESAKALQWEYLSAAAEDELELDEDEYLVEDLIGMMVNTSAGMAIGKVDEVAAYPAQDILVIGDVMIPFVDDFVKEVDFDTKTITVELIPGMLGEDLDE